MKLERKHVLAMIFLVIILISIAIKVWGVF
jgi:hypothetical protein